MIVVDGVIGLIVVVVVITLGVLRFQKNETKAGQVKRLHAENARYRKFMDDLDRDAYAQYTVSNNLFAGNVLDLIRNFNREDSK
jgi:hypothetical protein